MPERRVYHASGQGTSEVAIRARMNEDVYIVFAGYSNSGENPMLQGLYQSAGELDLGGGVPARVRHAGGTGTQQDQADPDSNRWKDEKKNMRCLQKLSLLLLLTAPLLPPQNVSESDPQFPAVRAVGEQLKCQCEAQCSYTITGCNMMGCSFPRHDAARNFGLVSTPGSRPRKTWKV